MRRFLVAAAEPQFVQRAGALLAPGRFGAMRRSPAPGLEAERLRMSDDIQCCCEPCATPFRCVGLGCCRLSASIPAPTMQPATVSSLMPASDRRDTVAAFLLARHQAPIAQGVTPQLLQWGEVQIRVGGETSHRCDCTKESASCPRCAYEAALRDAGAILALIEQARS
jgi:hypothetical protein